MGSFKTDLQAVMDKDPAATSKFVVWLTYPGFQAIRDYRFAHWLYTHNLKFFAHIVSSLSRFFTGVEIHPAAKIGNGVFIDHGMGVVIGETAEVGNNVCIYQGVTLGGTGKDIGKRHPTIEDDVLISSGAKVLGPFTVGKGSKIGAGSVVLKEVPPHSTVVGVPGRIVKTAGERVADLNQIKLPDPILEEFKRLNHRIEVLEKALDIHACRYSICNEDVMEEFKSSDMPEKNDIEEEK